MEFASINKEKQDKKPLGLCINPAAAPAKSWMLELEAGNKEPRGRLRRARQLSLGVEVRQGEEWARARPGPRRGRRSNQRRWLGGRKRGSAAVMPGHGRGRRPRRSAPLTRCERDPRSGSGCRVPPPAPLPLGESGGTGAAPPLQIGAAGRTHRGRRPRCISAPLMGFAPQGSAASSRSRHTPRAASLTGDFAHQKRGVLGPKIGAKMGRSDFT